ncbi:acyltransferase [Rheinheimera sp. 4Y26]|uniref:acyltransferase n=1 Tax=Rheinheimera sp. 4Y26 TaxID=2977811 RepID=UPI0021B11422|nr:acyltransferase [Rheinheimera sp. 4Y26]MCT6701088.1 acyltransferase [Rheinheimera sp. 4Y26]
MMLMDVFRLLRAPLALLLFSLNLTVWGMIVTVCGLLKLLLPLPALQRQVSRLAHWAYRHWSLHNRQLINLFNPVEWQLSGLTELKPDSWYLLISNHKSWLDIPVLSQFALERIPEPKFFLKEELKWVPFIGSASWALDMPFMKRYSQAQIQKNPALKGKDIETTKKSCEKFRHTPTTIINFVEGTRFTRAKHQHKNSPFRHLLPAKAGGIAFTLASMGPQFDAVLDVTLIYPDNPNHVLIDMLLGKLKRVVIQVEVLPVDDSIIGDYFNDEAFRQRFQQWLNQRWVHKDQQISHYLGTAPVTLTELDCSSV